MQQPPALQSSRATFKVKKQNTVISPEAGDPLQFFTLIEKVGEGSYGEIYRAISKTGPQIFALKIIDLEKTEDDIEDLLAEVDFQAKCDSPYLAKYCGSWMWENKLTIAMEYLGGGTLDELIRHCPLNEQQCAFIIREVLRGLFYMHKTLKIHRDIKPANILFDNTGSVKLADFGVAAQMTTNKRYRDTFVGTPLYLAPEIVLSLKYTEKVDIWSLGIMCIEIGTGTVPNGDMNPMDILYSIPTASPPQLPDSFSEHFKDFVKKCTVKSPNERLSAADLLKHPFMTQAETLDKNSIKPLLDRYRMKNNQTIRSKMPTTPTANQDDWWQSYIKSTATVSKASGVAVSSAPVFNRGPAAPQRSLAKPEISNLNARETFGKRGTNRGTKPLPMPGPMVRMPGVRDTANTNPTLENRNNVKTTEVASIPPPPAEPSRPASALANSAGPRPLGQGRPSASTPQGTPHSLPRAPSQVQKENPSQPAVNNAPIPLAQNVSVGTLLNSTAGSKDSLSRSRAPSTSSSNPSMIKSEPETYIPSTEAGPQRSNSNSMLSGMVPSKPEVPPSSRPRTSSNASRVSLPGASPATHAPPALSPNPPALNAPNNNPTSVPSHVSNSPNPQRHSSILTGPGAKQHSGVLPSSRPTTPGSIPNTQAATRPMSMKPLPTVSSPVAPPSIHTPLSQSPGSPSVLARSNSDSHAFSPNTGGNMKPAPLMRGSTVATTQAVPQPPTKGAELESLNSDFRQAFSQSFPPRISPVRFALLKAANDLFDSESKYSEDLLSIVENYVRPMMAEKNTVLKDQQLKAIFANVTKMHTFALHIQQSIKEFVSSIDSESTLDTGILNLFESLTGAIVTTYKGFAGALCRNLYETAGIMHDSGKFREFLSRQQAKDGIKPLHELLCLPIQHMTIYTRVYQELSRINSQMRPRFLELGKEILQMQEEHGDAVENSVELIAMLFNISEIPPAIILKPKQRMIITDSVLKLKLGGSNNSTIKKKKPARIYLLRDSIIMTRVLKQGEPEKFSLDVLLDPKKQFKPPKPCLQYRHIIPADFAECKSVNDREDVTNIFSITVSAQKGKTTHFAASTPEIKNLIVDALKVDNDE